MIVDSSLVVVEHFMTLREAEGTKRSMRDTAIEAAKSVVRPVTFSIFVIIMVYLPILTLEDIEGKMFRPMAQTVAMALLASLIYCFICIPVLAASCVIRSLTRRRGSCSLCDAITSRCWPGAKSGTVIIVTISVFLVSGWPGHAVGWRVYTDAGRRLPDDNGHALAERLTAYRH
jgi:cobalt-zinc-cadmium resistance protein CzcA